MKYYLGRKTELSHFGAIIFHNFLVDYHDKKCIDELKSLYGDKATFCDNWFYKLADARSKAKVGGSVLCLEGQLCSGKMIVGFCYLENRAVT